jgi:hypothetical protein
VSRLEQPGAACERLRPLKPRNGILRVTL